VACLTSIDTDIVNESRFLLIHDIYRNVPFRTNPQRFNVRFKIAGRWLYLGFVWAKRQVISSGQI
jgi:hypothetical protein